MTNEPKKILDKKTTFIYSVIFLAIVFVYLFCALVLLPLFHKHTLVKIEALAPTCTEDGNLEYWTCTDCGKYYEDEKASVKTNKAVQTLEKLDHIFTNPGCTTPATCIVCNSTSGESIGHDFEASTYVWNADKTACTATRVCKRDKRHIETETARVQLIDNCYTVCFKNSAFGQGMIYKASEDNYESAYEGENIPTSIGPVGTSFSLDKLGTISYPASNTAQDFDITYINGVNYRFVGMLNNTIRIYKENDYKNFIEINHVGQHNYIAISPTEMKDLNSKVLFTGSGGKLEWFACDISNLTSETAEYKKYSLYFDQKIIGNDATPCVDFENGIVYWYGYTTHYSDRSDDNKIIITAWDISGVDLSSPSPGPMKFISKNTVDNFGVMQGRTFFDGDVYLTVSIGNPIESKLIRLDAATGTVKSKIEFNGMTEIEGISYVIKDNRIKWYVSDYFDLYNLKIEK